MNSSSENIKKILTENQIIYTENEPMKDHTTFKIGGNAKLFITVSDIDELKLVIKACKENVVSYLVLGKGSNLLVSDEGIDGAVINFDGEFKNIEVEENEIFCGCSVALSKLCTVALENSLSKLEFAYGIPGTVGGAVFMNAGAYGGEMKDVIKSVTYLSADGNILNLNADKLDLSYRHSIFKENGGIILFATFKLEKSNKTDIKSKMDDFINRRKTKQPLEYPSAGSVFKRPQGNFAGTLIEQCGLKGFSIGGAQVSEKHAGFIINKNNATASDVLKLIEYIQTTVKKKTGYTLEREIIYIDK